MSDEFAVFVSPLGTDAGSGAKTDPLLSIASAITAAAAQQKVVIACSTDKAVFTTALALSGDVTARVYGGFDCATWVHGDARTLIAPDQRGPALTLEGVSGALVFEDLEFRSLDALDGEGESSIAAVVSKSDGVAFSRVLFAAGKGGAGRDGAEVEPYDGTALAGNDAMGSVGAAPRETTECGCDTAGGEGGNASAGINGDPGLPDYGGGKGGTGGKDCSEGGAGSTGAPAPTDTPFGTGAETHGTLTGTTWQPTPGQPGSTGKAGQGGGGGGGQGKAGGGAGGGGACGGCGGKGGEPGLGGGSSIGLLLVDSEVTFRDALIKTDNAGAGGDGGPGQDGQEGGLGGIHTAGGCPGGAGGDGAPGSRGGGGAGGLSVGILFRGLAPSLDGVTISTGARGVGGSGSTSSATSDDGLDGDNPETFDADS
ncbi:MAG TPA: hypothetical protein VHN73_01180 [Phenylobacterium sp.]|nr:hypothetical protein [Phenylobacterium sp.]